MMTLLLWRCPLCGTDDALKYQARLFRHDHLRCTNCGTVWQVTRVIGDDYRLKVIAGNSATVGMELPLAGWYDRLKAGFRLVPRNDGAAVLGSNELLYLEGEKIPLIVRVGNPLLSRWEEREAPKGPLPEELTPKWGAVGTGKLYLTNERLIWQNQARVCNFCWQQVNAIFVFYIDIFGIMYGTTTYRFGVPKQSILKWLTYSGTLAKEIESENGHRIRVSNY